MKKLLLILSLLLLTTNVYAEWTFFGESVEDSVMFYDNSTVKRNGDKVRVWMYINVSPEQVKSRNMGSARSLNEIDCVNETFKTLSLSAYTKSNLKGEVRHTTEPDPTIVYIPPSSTYATLMKLVCKK